MWISKIEIPSCKLKRKIWATPSVQGDHQDSSIFDPSWELARFEKFFFSFLESEIRKVREQSRWTMLASSKMWNQNSDQTCFAVKSILLSLEYFLTFFYIWCQRYKYQTTSFSKSYLDISLFALNVFKALNCFICNEKCLTNAICFCF